jgi:hypothetical protein
MWLKPGTRIARFWAKVDRSDPDGCWPWIGHRIRKGYGIHWAFNRKTVAHRRAYELTYGSIPDGLFVCHHCDNPPCCNPDHLFVGTNSDNMQDCIRKGRFSKGSKPKTYCKRGHLLAEHAYTPPSGRRQCRTCQRDLDRARYAAGVHRIQRRRAARKKVA